MKLIAWNRCYGCMAFDVYIAYNENIEEKKKIYEDMGYYCWIEKEEMR